MALDDEEMNAVSSALDTLIKTMDHIIDSSKRETAAFSARTEKSLTEIRATQIETFGRNNSDVEFSARYYAKGVMPEQKYH